jgi:hypothetical protein
MRLALRGLVKQASWVRASSGSVPHYDTSRLPPEDWDRASQETEPLPAENVAYLGRTLFTDYLLAVELGGTLLLVATIGAIAIAGRRTEGRR